MSTKNPIAALQAVVESKLAFIPTDPIDWRAYVIAFSWSVWAFESYLMYVFLSLRINGEELTSSLSYRQFSNFSRPHPPTALKSHFTEEVFRKSQRYGRDKARFQVISKLYSQILDTAAILLGAFPWAWITAGNLLAKFGYGPEYEVCLPTPPNKYSSN